MGACAILPRLIGQGRASELLFTGRVMTADEGERWGFHNRVVAPEELAETALVTARDLASGPSFAHGMTKTQLNIEWRSEEHTSELQSLMRNPYAVFCLTKKKKQITYIHTYK